ncbi:25S rRNA (uracil2843-N3)-methyltransferase [Sporobolomyces koalae]|uniref:25S rRNA (uracil2843-N3)-methyltransferase n=1 Tax=Sporobolomyces koalae TaxID=500713 RepID=UPI003179BFAF
MVQLNNTFKQLAIRDDSAPRSRSLPTARAKSSTSSSPTNATSTLDPSTRSLLTVLSHLTSTLRRSNQFTPTLQHVKSLLYNKEYLQAFGTVGEEGERWREVYFARWTPARAVLYERAFKELRIASLLGYRQPETDIVDDDTREVSEQRRKREEKASKSLSTATTIQSETSQVNDVIMVGAGAGAELVALGCILGNSTRSELAPTRPKIRIQAIDQGSWGTLVHKMDQGMQTEWPTLTRDTLQVDFVEGDLLSAYSTTEPSSTTSSPSAPPPLKLDLSSPRLKLVTICFTITELLLQSRVSTLRFLSTLTASAPRGLHLLIIESASLALIPIGTSGRTYPLGQLLDHALTGGGDGGKWEIVESEEAKWFRMPPGAEEVYNQEVEDSGKGIKVKLENSRVVLRYYRKL